jgi:hypothetical protein
VIRVFQGRVKTFWSFYFAEFQMKLLILFLIIHSSFASNAANTIVTPFLVEDGYTRHTWNSYPPGGCTGEYKFLRKVFTKGNIKQWTGKMKADAVQMVAEEYNYMVIARYLRRYLIPVALKLQAHALSS